MYKTPSLKTHCDFSTLIGLGLKYPALILPASSSENISMT
jgi:hypothetical protein